MYRADEEYPKIKRFCRWISDAAHDYLWESHEQQKGLSTKMVEAELEPADFRQKPTSGVLKKVPELVRCTDEGPTAPGDIDPGHPKPRFSNYVEAVTVDGRTSREPLGDRARLRGYGSEPMMLDKGLARAGRATLEKAEDTGGAIANQPHSRPHSPGTGKLGTGAAPASKPE